jgi:Uma2 family endonuclease
MAQVTHSLHYTRAEYISFERASNVRHEFLNGVIYAMAGGSREHAAIAANVITALSLALRGRTCSVHSSDLRIRVVETGLETYPDVTVVCGRAEIDPEDRHVVTNPVLVVGKTMDRGRAESHVRPQPRRLRRSGVISRWTRFMGIRSRGDEAYRLP